MLAVNMSSGSVVTSGTPTKQVPVNSSRDSRKTKIALARIPGVASGRVTVRKVRGAEQGDEGPFADVEPDPVEYAQTAVVDDEPVDGEKRPAVRRHDPRPPLVPDCRPATASGQRVARRARRRLRNLLQAGGAPVNRQARRAGAT